MSDRFTQRRLEFRRQRWFRILVAVLALVLIGVVVWLIWFSSALTVRSVDISGQTTLEVKQIEKAADVPIGTPLVRVDLAAIESRVQQMPRIRTAEVSRSWPHTISIEVEERTAVMWTTIEGQIHGIDRFGVDYRTYSKKPDGLVEAKISGTDAEVRLEATRAVADVAHFLRTQKPDWIGDLRSITAQSRDSVSLDLSKGRTIVWGSADNGERKLDVLRTLLTIKASGYDVSAPDQPTTKK